MTKFHRLFKLFLNANSYGFGNILIVTAVAGLSLFVGSELIKRGQRASDSVKDQIRNREARVGAEKILTAAAFMVSNNLVICKEGGFGGSSETCRWQPSTAFESPDKFGLASPSISNNRLTFGISSDTSFFTNTQRFKFLEGDLKFSLIDGNEEDLDRFLGDKADNLEKIDRDNTFVKVELRIKYKGAKKTSEGKTIAYYRRPVANITTSVKADSICKIHCKSARSQNPHSSCRGKQKILSSARVEISLVTTNHGPGRLYDLKYKKRICILKDGDMRCRISGDNPSIQMGSHGLGVGESIRWTDQVDCPQFSETLVKKDAADISQHISNAGRVEYLLDAEDAGTKIEPFRMNYAFVQEEDNLPGIKHTIYVDPPH